MVERREDFTDVAYVAPEDGLEQQVAGIMAEVLGLNRVGRDDSFYDFGGTSLQAIRICARIELKLGLKALPLWLFSNDILRAFVAELRAQTEQAHA